MLWSVLSGLRGSASIRKCKIGKFDRSSSSPGCTAGASEIFRLFGVKIFLIPDYSNIMIKSLSSGMSLEILIKVAQFPVPP